jgi:hypothetical protein
MTSEKISPAIVKTKAKAGHFTVRMSLLALAALGLMAAAVPPARAQALMADNRAPDPMAVAPAPAAQTAQATPTQLPAAPSAEMQAELNTNPFANSGLAALSSDAPAGQTGNSLTSNPAPAKSGHRALALAGGIAGTALAGFGTFMLVGGAGCHANCGAQHLGEITLPIGAAVAAVGYYYFFHHSN